MIVIFPVLRRTTELHANLSDAPCSINWSALIAVDERYLIVVNFSPGPAQARVQVRWPDAGGGSWELVDELSGATYERDGDEMALRGLYVELGPWNFHLLQCRRTKNSLDARGRPSPPNLSQA